MSDKEKQKRLIDACNLLCHEVRENLPEGWEIVLRMNNVEASMSLESPEGDDIEYDGSDSHYSGLSAAIDQANFINGGEPA